MWSLKYGEYWILCNHLHFPTSIGKCKRYKIMPTSIQEVAFDARHEASQGTSAQVADSG